MSTNTKLAEPVNASAVLRNVLNTLKHENSKPDGSISDTIWYSAYETLLDYVESSLEALAAHDAEQAALRDLECPPDPEMVDRALAADDQKRAYARAALAQRQPLTDEQIESIRAQVFAKALQRRDGCDDETWDHWFAHAIERAHGIGATTGEQQR